MSRLRKELRGLCLATCAVLSLGGETRSEEIGPATTEPAGEAVLGRYSRRTLVLALLVDRNGLDVIGFTVKDRPFVREIGIPSAQPNAADSGSVRLEVALVGPKGHRYTQRVETQGLCLDHPPGTEPHIQGDTIRLHRESLIVEVPEIQGFDRVEGVYYERAETEGVLAAVPLGAAVLGRDRFDPAGGRIPYEALELAREAGATAPIVTEGLVPGAETSDVGRASEALLTSGLVHWPEEYGDPETFIVFGDAGEIDRRINIVLVPDGYAYTEKATMQAHAQSLVAHLRSKTPYAEHDRFVNYILVYAYSTQSGTDQCDCGIVKDTAMNTRFLNAVPTCGASENRCLYYGSGSGTCDPSTSQSNISAAELRAPARDKTVVMVNTTRYGGCGGSRAVYAAGNGVAADIAAHELGHSLAGLADEYVSYSGCGSSAGGVNTSLNGVDGAWPEWIAELGAPRAGAQYYPSCVYRPDGNCDMRTLNQPFCAVCNQHWALLFFGHFRVNPTAPISSSSPGSYVAPQVGQPVDFSVETRLASGPSVTNDLAWAVQGPGDPGPVTVQQGTAAHTHVFGSPGSYTLTCEVIADTNFIKPSRTGGNRDVRTWSVEAVPVPEVSDEAARLMTVAKNPAGGVDIRFEDTASSRYNLYVSRSPGTLPFRVSDPASGAKRCALSGVVPVGGGMNQISGFNLEQGIAGGTDLLCFLVTADNGSGTEGPLGLASSGAPRTSDSWCSHEPAAL